MHKKNGLQKEYINNLSHALRVFICVAAVLFLGMQAGSAAAFTIDAQSCSPQNVCTSFQGTYRWLLEEDNTNQKTPGIRVGNSIGLDIHNSHAPVVCTGTGPAVDGTSCLLFDPAKSYYLTVLPDSGHSLGGYQVAVGQTSVTVYLHQHLIPTAQISVIVFKDHNPINNILDAGEPGIGGTAVILSDIMGPMLTDAFANPLGTIYDGNGVPLKSGNAFVDGNNAPITGLVTCTQAEVNTYTAASDALKPLLKKCTRVGELYIKNLAPGKYGIRVTSPSCGTGPCATGTYVQTSTIEGTPGVDAWVKANEPAQFIEGFGVGFYHVFIGFVFPAELTWSVAPPAGPVYNVSGVNRFNHFGRPPVNQGFVAGAPVAQCWIGLNDLAAPAGKGLMAVPCGEDGAFTLSGVPSGTYQLVTWDKPLDALFGFNTVIVNGADLNLGNVLSFRWFGTLQGYVFWDPNQNGFRDPTDASEIGLVNRTVNIRFRDGSMYQTTATDLTGFYSFSEVFPFFKWLVTEVDFVTEKPTGITAVADDGGAFGAHQQIVPEPPQYISTYPSFDQLAPQPQHTPSTWLFGGARPGPTPADLNPNTGNNLSRSETGPVLTEAMMLFLNQINVLDWGKYSYAAGENGGITGIVFYGTTRAENDPSLNTGETWEPGIPRVQIALYQDADDDNVIDDLSGNGVVDLADIDNHPLGWAEGTAPKGPEDVVRCGDGTTFCSGDAYRVAWTDSWDDNKPSDCIQPLPYIQGAVVQPQSCYDNYSTWNQLRPGIFDGGYAFGLPAGDTISSGLSYIVEALPPPGYEIQKEEDKNVDFGDEYTPGTLLLPPPCVGTPANGLPLHTVPQFLTLFPAQQVPAPSAGLVTPLCSMKKVFVADAKNAAADFSMFTFVPKAARVVGFVNNDLSAEFNAASPIFGEKASPAWLPVSFQDWQGREVAHVYTDEFGSYNALLPSTYTINPPIATGVSPNMITAVLNYPLCVPGGANPFCEQVGTLPDKGIDRNYNPNFSITPWTLDYWPGKTTYLDTPIVPVGAFVGFPHNGPDIEMPDGTPMISWVDNNSALITGPVVCADGDTLTITSSGSTTVLNPDYDPALQNSKEIQRDYGFGTIMGSVTLNGIILNPANVTWSNSTITLNIPSKAAVSTGQLMVLRGDNGRSTEVGITLQVPADCNTVKFATQATGIQPVIDAAADGDIVVVEQGIYLENVILYKGVTLQGMGAGATVIFANPTISQNLAAWHTKVRALLCTPNADPFANNDTPGIMVLGNILNSVDHCTGTVYADPVRIDGFKIFGAISGGGIYVNTDVSDLKITNNRINGNQGQLGGGIAAGIPTNGPVNNNPGLLIESNHITKNGGVQGGGGITIYDAADNYIIRNNRVSGNFSRFYGGGISHWGLSDNGLIEGNRIVFNETAFGGAAFADGAGIFVGSQIPIVGPPAALGTGTGSVTINANLIQGNLAGVGSGGGIRAISVNGLDTNNPDPASWYKLNIINNIIVNNVAGYYGGAIALQDVAAATIINNTVANNTSTSTAANAFEAGNVNSTPQPAGIVSNVHSGALATNTGQGFSDPILANNIIYNNRSYYTTNGGVGGILPNPDASRQVWDLQVIGTVTPQLMSPVYSLLTSTAEYPGNGNISANPAFVQSYQNTLYSAAVIDEGGNFITIRMTPLSQAAGDYHIRPLSPAVDAGTSGYPFFLLPQYLGLDYDRAGRPQGLGVDIGADEYAAVTTGGLLSIKIGTFNTGAWKFDLNYNGFYEGCTTDTCITSYGQAGDLPVVGDWSGSGITRPGYYRLSSGRGTWHLDDGDLVHEACGGAGLDACVSAFGGWSTDIPVVGDWNGTGSVKIGIYRIIKDKAFWYLDNGNGVFDGCGGFNAEDLCLGPFNMTAGDIPVVGDWNGNLLADIGIYRLEGGLGMWYLDDGSRTMTAASVGPFGTTGDLPVTGDWTNTGSTKIGVYRGGSWLLDDGDGTLTSCATDLCRGPFGGTAGDIPVVGK